MEDVVFMFPGVGVQNTGMGKSFYDNFKIVRETFEQASDILKRDIAQMCFMNSQKEKLFELANSQSALLTVCVAMHKVFVKETGIIPKYSMGHSLGEYSALCSAGAIEFSQALKLVEIRSEIITEVSKTMDGVMMWVINIDRQTIEEVCCEESKNENKVFISAFDSPSQFSISGDRNNVMKVAKQLEGKGALIYPLKMNGPFHSQLMYKATEKFKSELINYRFCEFKYPVISNMTGLPYDTSENIVDNLSLQLMKPIKWTSFIEFLENEGIERAIEIDPKNNLKYLMEKNTENIKTFSVENIADLSFVKTKSLNQSNEQNLELIGRCLGAIISTKNNNEDDDKYNKGATRCNMKSIA
ncbi:malonyl CoA-acyl carrier protein transacylase [Clostridium putrefaciens]|uniref:[acyl-carrier-protein] S-malonyltransferase n=1 Tax=Clostridium putrefaciens TaxID=99675 RepID=A0A381JAB3_9CLOT|nr:ACP S-malonyltransferase [Clostridium putrefaciens]SUY47678.1 malonyl CoA-acyl carrier protein transacylase [Clostridium putrefaciens]